MPNAFGLFLLATKGLLDYLYIVNINFVPDIMTSNISLSHVLIHTIQLNVVAFLFAKLSFKCIA